MGFGALGRPPNWEMLSHVRVRNCLIVESFLLQWELLCTTQSPTSTFFLAFSPSCCCSFVSGWRSELLLIQLSGETVGKFPFFNVFPPKEGSTIMWSSKKRYSCIIQALFKITRYFVSYIHLTSPLAFSSLSF